MTYNAKESLYRYVDSLRKQLRIDSYSYPLNTIDICKSDDTTDVEYHKFSTNGFCAAALIGDRTDTVVINLNRTPEEQNFDCGHELVHLTKHRNKGINIFSCYDLGSKATTQNPILEWEANEGSAELVAPYRLLLPGIKQSGFDLTTYEGISNLKIYLSEKFGVSVPVIKYRLESLKYEIYQYLNGMRLDSIRLLSKNQLFKENIQIQSLNDIEETEFVKLWPF